MKQWWNDKYTIWSSNILIVFWLWLFQGLKKWCFDRESSFSLWFVLHQQTNMTRLTLWIANFLFFFFFFSPIPSRRCSSISRWSSCRDRLAWTECPLSPQIPQGLLSEQVCPWHSGCQTDTRGHQESQRGQTGPGETCKTKGWLKDLKSCHYFLTLK